LTLAGLLFSAWARVHLGGNWSGIVTVKEDHELVRSGPYGIVRHPIYSGLLLAVVGSALARGEWRGVVAVVIVFWAFRRKMQTEERWMRERFGNGYQAYSERVPALVPFIF
jgi:protein-S-isoprenylcysteine O-methyltransferase Ste14